MAKSLQNGKIKKYKKWQDKIKWQIFLNGKIIKYWQKKLSQAFQASLRSAIFKEKQKNVHVENLHGIFLRPSLYHFHKQDLPSTKNTNKCNCKAGSVWDIFWASKLSTAARCICARIRSIWKKTPIRRCRNRKRACRRLIECNCSRCSSRFVALNTDKLIRAPVFAVGLSRQPVYNDRLWDRIFDSKSRQITWQVFRRDKYKTEKQMKRQTTGFLTCLKIEQVPLKTCLKPVFYSLTLFWKLARWKTCLVTCLYLGHVFTSQTDR